MFKEEIHRADILIAKVLKEFELYAKGMLSAIDGLVQRKDTENLMHFWHEATEHSQAYIKAQQYIAALVDVLQSIAIAFDSKNVKNQSLLYLKANIRWNMSGHSAFVVVMSDIYETIRTADEDKNTKWIAPTSFERVTNKYW